MHMMQNWCKIAPAGHIGRPKVHASIYANTAYPCFDPVAAILFFPNDLEYKNELQACLCQPFYSKLI